MEKENYIARQETPSKHAPSAADQDADRIIIKPTGSMFDFGNVLAYRELLYFLAWRDVKVRYKQTLLGVVWVLLQPVLTTLIFTILFARFAASTGETIPYPLFAFCGFVLWTFAGNAISNAANSLTNHTGLITKVYFPRLIVPFAAVAASFVDLLISLAILLIVLIVFGAKISWTIVFAPFFILLLILFALGLGTLFAALNVRFRDVKFVLPFALQILMFASPVFYSLDFLPERARFWWKFNPLTGMLNGFRSAIFGIEFDVLAISVSVISTFFLFIAALFVFRRMEDDFADLI